MRRKFRHDALLILLICSWIPVAIAAALIWAQMRSYLTEIDEARVQRRLDQAKITLNSQMLDVESVAEILLATRELNDFMSAGRSVRTMTSNLLYGRISLLVRKAPEISSFTVLDKTLVPVFSFPPRQGSASSYSGNSVGFFLVDQNTLRYYRPITYDDQEFQGPAAKLKGFLILDVDLHAWRKSVGGTIKINSISSQSSISNIDLEIDDNSVTAAWQYVPYLIVLVVVLVIVTAVGLYLMRSRIVKPITDLTRRVSLKMGKAAPDDRPRHEIEMLEESFETYVRFERELQTKLLQQSTLAAIGRTTQMLAHDVRKPFAMLKSLLQLVRSAKDPADIHHLVHDLAPEIDRATQAVEGLIRDVIDVGSNREPNREIVHLSSLIQTTLADAVRAHSGCDLTFRYRFEHRNALNVDPVELSRVFTNIITNAIEAMHGRGELRFEARNCGEPDSMAEIVIGNSGSFIPEEKRERLFEAFFTEGKSSGTGLGLAIAKKFITDHGGTIRCRSSVADGTEFIFTVPMSDAPSRDNTDELPVSSRGIEALSGHIELNHDLPDTADQEITLVDQIIDIAKQGQRLIKILIADDESLYRRALESQLVDSPLRPYVRLAFAHSGEQAISLYAGDRFDIVIMDVNFGGESIDGFDATRQLRSGGSRASLCIHSNCGIIEYQRKAIASGADLFILKPMSRPRLYGLIHSALTERPSAQNLKLIT